MEVGIITSAIKNIFVILSVVILFTLFLTHPKIVSEAVSVTLSMCFIKLIPSIFPFMVISGFLINTLGEKNVRGKRNLDKCKIPYLTILLSWISGFVVGPKYLCQDNLEDDLTPLVFLCSNAGIGFVISYVGVTLWGSLTFGFYLYFIQIFWSVIIYLFVKNKTGKIVLEKRAIPLLTSLSSTIQGSTMTMLNICGFTVFFSVISAIFSIFFSSEIILLSISSAFEISSGIFSAVTSKSNVFCAFFTGFSIGFGGICMCMQTFAVCGESNINKQKFLLLKMLHGTLCGASSLIFVSVNKQEPLIQAYLDFNSSQSIISALVSALFLCSLLFLTKKYLKNKLYSI